jgi:hypothetical protein
MISFGLGKEFLQFYWVLIDFKVILSNPWRSIRVYTLHQEILILIFIEKVFKGLLQVVKGITPL